MRHDDWLIAGVVETGMYLSCLALFLQAKYVNCICVRAIFNKYDKCWALSQATVCIITPFLTNSELKERVMSADHDTAEA